jgi:hypothetical protein
MTRPEWFRAHSPKQLSTNHQKLIRRDVPSKASLRESSILFGPINNLYRTPFKEKKQIYISNNLYSLHLALLIKILVKGVKLC